ncbi:MAG: hypothetical protein AABY22_12300 [Nanoarchaeota archaeon]
MTQEISNKTWVLMLIGGDRHFLTEREAQAIKEAIIKGDKFIDLEDVFFATNQFVKLMKGSDYQKAENYRKGDYFCETHKNWIPKGKTCGRC